MAVALKRSTLIVIISIISVVLTSILIVATVVILNTRNDVGLQKNKASTFNSCSAIRIPNVIGAKQMPPSLTLITNTQDTINAPTTISVEGIANTSYHVLYAEYTGQGIGQGSVPLWSDGFLDIKTSSSLGSDSTKGNFSYTPTIPQPHASFFNPNAYSYMYTFVPTGTQNSVIGTSTGYSTPGDTETTSDCVTWLYIKRLTCSINMTLANGTSISKGSSVGPNDSLLLSTSWADDNGTAYQMPASSSSKSIYYTWMNKVDTNNIWKDYGFPKSNNFASSMNFDGAQTFTKSEYTLDVYDSIGGQYRLGPDTGFGYNQPSCYSYVNVNRTSTTPTPTNPLPTATTTSITTSPTNSPQPTASPVSTSTQTTSTMATTTTASITPTSTDISTPVLSTQSTSTPSVTTSTVTPGKPTSLPNTGIFDQVILPTVGGIFLVLLGLVSIKLFTHSSGRRIE